MKLHILSIAYALAPVGPDAVGGAEQILTHLDRALVHAGHRSTVIACHGSTTTGQLIAPAEIPNPITEERRSAIRANQRECVAGALRDPSIDLVHMHGIDFLEYLPPPGLPVVVTLHLPPAWYPPEVFSLPRPQTFLHCVSYSQQQACPSHVLPLPVIENGVPVPDRLPLHAKRRFALTLGRICPEKGLHIAMDAARQADAPLLVAGTVFPYRDHQLYFEQEIVPRLDRFRKFIGPLGVHRKHRFLAAARCLLIPSQAPETSSLVAMEALACGTPVIAFASGALPEIIEHGRTGFVVSDEREMAKALRHVDAIDRRTCWETARARFSLGRMVQDYFGFYEEILGGVPARTWRRREDPEAIRAHAA